MTDILIGKGKNQVFIKSEMLNRHGLIAGATGTGKTTTLKVIAERASMLGIPVFIPDVKGDLYGLHIAGEENEKITERLNFIGDENFKFQGFPVQSWDILEDFGVPIRATVSDLGPILLSNLLELNDVQTGILNIAFKVADERGLLILDFKDLKSMLNYISEHSKELRAEYGNISPQSVGAINRALLVLENEGAEKFFGEPALDVNDLMKKTPDGKGIINILNSKVLFQRPKLYTTFLLWFLSEIYEILPEVGDLEIPKMLFFFDEAHLIFSQGSKVLKDKLLQVIKLIRSKGVGVFFVTQSPGDIPEDVLSQLGNKIQHALRAFTPKDRKMIKDTAMNFRENPNLDIESALTNMKSGEALVSCLDEKGLPQVTEKALIMPPMSSFDTMSAEDIKAFSNESIIMSKYKDMIDRVSAYEVLLEERKRIEAEQEKLEQEKVRIKEEELSRKEAERIRKEEERLERERKKNRSELEKFGGKVINSMVGTASRKIGNELMRGIFGTLLGKK